MVNRRHILPISSCEQELRLACDTVGSGRYCRHRTGDAELPLHISQPLPTPIGMPHRMPEVSISSREQELRLACNTIVSSCYCRYRTGDGDLALHISQPLPTPVCMPHRMPEVSISSREQELRLACD